MKALVDELNKKINASSKDMNSVVETIQILTNIMRFLMETFPKFEPTCIGYVASLLVSLTDLHDALAKVNYHEQCEELVSLIYSVTVIIGQNIGNIVVETNMQAYCASHLFTTLLTEDFSLKEFLQLKRPSVCLCQEELN